jgi:hypothetical protein
MPRFLSLVVVLTLACHASAADKPAPFLSPDEIAQGWVHLFDGETMLGWTASEGSKWLIREGALGPQGRKPATLTTTSPFDQFKLILEYRFLRETKARVWLSCGPDGPAEGKADGGVPIDLPFQGDGWTLLNLKVSGRQITGTRMYLDDVRPFDGAVAGIALPSSGKPGFIALAGSGVVFRNIRLLPLGTTSIFNGKNLSGWKEFPGKKSKFSVSKEGLLELKDGPGDLQTEGLYGDFVLQLDCRSNGKHLNSGIFFRCRPSEYQQGYEAQIRNQFADKPTQEYTIEEYDPKTHELKEKRKLLSPAIDYGTGGIYRRMPARRELSRDGEWFTMTIVANGRHISTWVNGVQQVDWTDNRPEKDNARQGCRLEKGAISIQGHDPTTALSFRSFRIAEFAGGK